MYSTRVAEANIDKQNHPSMPFPAQFTVPIMDANRAGLINKDIPADGSQNIQTTAWASRAFLMEMKLVKLNPNLKLLTAYCNISFSLFLLMCLLTDDGTTTEKSSDRATLVAASNARLILPVSSLAVFLMCHK